MKIIENPTWEIKNTNSVCIAGLQFIFPIPNGTSMVSLTHTNRTYENGP